jgi:hypothetical protein
MADVLNPRGPDEDVDLFDLVRPGRRWAFDVDGTLIGSIRSDVIRPGAASLLAALVRREVVCVMWSAGGDDYAHRMAVRHGLADHVSAYYTKDIRDADGTYRMDHFAPAHLPDVLVDDSPIDLRADTSRRVIAVRQFLGGHLADRELLDLYDRVEQRETDR